MSGKKVTLATLAVSAFGFAAFAVYVGVQESDTPTWVVSGVTAVIAIVAGYNLIRLIRTGR